MGIHFGIIAARLPWADFFSELNKDYGEFLDQGEVTNPEEAGVEANDSGWRILGGELAGVSYVLDTSFLLSDSPDSLGRIAKERNTTVIGCGAETVSGTFWVFAAQGGTILRRYHSCHSGMKERFERGTPLPSEVKIPIEELDGHGLIGVLNHFGFDYDRWFREGKRRVYQFTYDRHPEKGPLALEYQEHYRKHKLAPNERPPVQVVMRSAPKSSRRGCLGTVLGFWWGVRKNRATEFLPPD